MSKTFTFDGLVSIINFGLVLLLTYMASESYLAAAAVGSGLLYVTWTVNTNIDWLRRDIKNLHADVAKIRQ